MKARRVVLLARQNPLDDSAEPYLWSDEELLDYADEAQEEAARRARLFLDSTTSAITTLTLVNGTAVYALDSRVIRVERARVVGQELPLRLMLTRTLDTSFANWEASIDPVCALVPDWETNKVRFVGIPQAAGTVNLQVIRRPITPLVNMDQDLEIADHHARNLIHWIAHRAFMKRDSETFNSEKSEMHLGRFEAEFGAAQPAYDEAWITRNYTVDPENGYF